MDWRCPNLLISNQTGPILSDVNNLDYWIEARIIACMANLVMLESLSIGLSSD